MPEFASFDPQGAGWSQSASLMDRAATQRRAEYEFQQKQIEDQIMAPVNAAKQKAALSKFNNDITAESQMHDLTATANQDMIGLRHDWIDAMKTSDSSLRISKMNQVLGSASRFKSLKGIGDEVGAWMDVFAQNATTDRTLKTVEGSIDRQNLITQNAQAVQTMKDEVAKREQDFKNAQKEADDRRIRELAVQRETSAMDLAKFRSETQPNISPEVMLRLADEAKTAGNISVEKYWREFAENKLKSAAPKKSARDILLDSITGSPGAAISAQTPPGAQNPSKPSTSTNSGGNAGGWVTKTIGGKSVQVRQVP